MHSCWTCTFLSVVSEKVDSVLAFSAGIPGSNPTADGIFLPPFSKRFKSRGSHCSTIKMSAVKFSWNLMITPAQGTLFTKRTKYHVVTTDQRIVFYCIKWTHVADRSQECCHCKQLLHCCHQSRGHGMYRSLFCHYLCPCCTIGASLNEETLLVEERLPCHTWGWRAFI